MDRTVVVKSVAAVLDGAVGSYITTPDVNKLDADSAHLVQSVGLWTVGALSSTYSYFGSTSLKVTGGVSTAATPGTDAAYFAVMIYSVAGDTFDVNGGTAVVVAAGTWTEVKGAGNAGTYTVNAAGSADYYLDAVIVSATDVAFVPSLRIVGDIDMRTDVELPNYYVNQVYLSTGYGGATVYDFLPAATGKVGTRYGDGTVDRLKQLTPNSTFVNDTRYVVRITRVLGGVSSLYVDGVAQTATAAMDANPGSISMSYGLIAVGAHGNGASRLTGDIFYAEVRDGVDGPIVALFDAAEMWKANPTTPSAYTGSDGRTWTPGGSITYTNTGETVGVTDSVSHVLAAKRTVTDSVDSTDAVSVKAPAWTVASSVEATDTVSYVSTFVRPVTELADITDTISTVQTFKVTVTDSVDVSDLAAKTESNRETVPDPIDVTDTTVVKVGKTETDAVDVTDLVSTIQTSRVTVTDTADVSDVVTGVKTAIRTVTDTADIADTIATVQTIRVTVTELITVTDSPTRVATYLRTVTDTATINDVVVSSIPRTGLATETVNITDTISTLKYVALVETKLDPHRIYADAERVYRT